MYCPYCGNKTPDGGRFCIRCGGNLEELLKEETENSAAENFIVENAVVEIESLETEAELPALPEETTQLITEDNVLTNMIVTVDTHLLNIKLLDEEKINYYKENYFNNGKYSFPLGGYTISYDEDIVMSINTDAYFEHVAEEVMNYCNKRYTNEIRKWEDREKIEEIYSAAMAKIVSYTSRYLVASGIMSYTEKKIEKMISESLLPQSELIRTLEKCIKKYNSVKAQYDSAETVREMNKMLSGKSSYIAGGFGFKGVLGGMAAAGVANAASGIMGSIKDGVAKSSNAAKMQKGLDAILQDQEVLESLVSDIGEAVLLSERIYEQACLLEYNTEIRNNKYCSSDMKGVADNTMRYINDKEVILKNLSEVIESAPLSARTCLLYLAGNFYDNKEVSEQLLELSEFLLLGKEVQGCIQKKKEEQLEVIFKLPEKTSDDAAQKLDQLAKKSEELFYDASEELQRLRELQKKLLEEEARRKAIEQEQEAKRKAEEQARRENEAKIRNLMQERISSAQKVDNAIQSNNMALFGEMSASGDIVAEERYIEFYIMKIKNEKNKKLFDAIAGQCGNNRAYDCIIGVCCFEGYGTIENRDIAKELLLQATKSGCTYAKGYLARMVIIGMTDVWIKERAQIHVKDLLQQLSPYICAWSGIVFCKGTAEGGRNEVPNDYDKALFYTEYAYQCGMEEAKDTYYYLQEHSASEINAKRYTSDSSCYITTAVCNSFGKADDCYELTLFRNFRDSYLLKQPDGKQLVEEYYVKAPKIVAQIDALPQKDTIYYRIWNQYLQRCMGLIQNNELDSCKNVYIEMVRELEASYLL